MQAAVNGLLHPVPLASHLRLEVPPCFSDLVINLIAVISLSPFSPGMTKRLIVSNRLLRDSPSSVLAPF